MDAPTKYLAALFIASLASLPNMTAKVDHRSFVLGIQIHLDRSSPAYAAWEDSIEVSLPTIMANQVQQKSTLKVGSALKSMQLTIQKTANQAPKEEPAQIRHLEKIVVYADSQPEVPSAEAQSIVSYQTLGQKLVNEELVRRSLERVDSKIIQTQSGSDIIVQKPGAKLPQYANVQFTSSALDDTTKKSRPETTNASSSRNFTIAGFSGLSGGAALYGSNHEIFVRHVVGDKTLNFVRASTEDGSFALVAKNMEGELMAELVTPQGDVIAQGKKSLPGLPQGAADKVSKAEIFIEMQPVVNSLVARAISATLEPTKTIETASVFISGVERHVAYNSKEKLWRDSGFSAGSQLSLRAQAQSHYTTVKWLETGREQYLKLYPDTYVKALKELVHGRGIAAEKYKDAVVWGKITRMGFPVSGARVELVGETVAPTYFTGFIPDNKRTSTSKSGDFAFASTPADELLLKISVGEVSIWPSMISTYYGSVTQSDVEIAEMRSVQWHSFDLFSNQSVATVFSPLGDNLMYATDTAGRATERIQTTNGLTFVEADASEKYIPTRFQLRADQTVVDMPQFENEWLKSLVSQKGITLEAAKRVVIGHVAGDDYDVVVNAEFAKDNIIYFNSSGQIIATGEAGGGFILFGLPEGLHTIGIIPEKSKTLMTKTAYVDELATQVLQYNMYL